MKIKLIFLTVILLITGLYSGCKKGDEDPLFSILSRKARVCGNWKVTEGRVSYGTPDIIEIDDYSEFGHIAINLILQGSITGSYCWTFEINKDGSYEIFKSISLPYNSSYVLKEQGFWYFLTKNKKTDKKSKECIVFQPTLVTFDLATYEYQASSPTVYDIIQLKNKKMKLEGNRNYKKTDGTSITEEVINESIVLTPED